MDLTAVVRTGVLLLVAALAGSGAAPAAVAADIPVPLNACVETDNGDPVVTGLDVSPRSVRVTDRARRVTVTVTAEDTGGPGPAAGLYAVSVVLARADTPDGRAFPLQQVGPTTWQGSVWLMPGDGVRGQFGVAVSMADRASNAVLVTPSRLIRQGLAPDLEVSGSTRRDVQPPTMTSLRFSSRRVDSRRGDVTVEVRSRWRDDWAGVGRVEVSAWVAGTQMALTRGSHRNGVWTGRLTVGRWVGSQQVRVYVKAFDRVGNRRIYGQQALRGHGLPATLDVVALRDRYGPVPAAVSTLPAALDVRSADGTVPVRVHVTDNKSGTTVVRAYVTDGSYRSPYAPLHLASGTRRDGMWEGTVIVPSCRANTATYQLAVRTEDMRGASRDRAVTARTMSVTAGDHGVLPIGGRAVSWVDPVRFEVSFAEDVVGVSSTSARLERVDFRPEYRTVPIAGTWACADAAGGQVDCVTGPVRSAVVTLTEPHQQTSTYRAVLNPEHVLDVRDLAGNPVRRMSVYLGQESSIG